VTNEQLVNEEWAASDARLKDKEVGEKRTNECESG